MLQENQRETLLLHLCKYIERKITFMCLQQTHIDSKGEVKEKTVKCKTSILSPTAPIERQVWVSYTATTWMKNT